MATAPLAGNPTVWGNKKVETVDWDGPASYTAGGQPFLASTLGWGAIEAVIGSVSQSGTYRASPKFTGDGAKATVYITIVTVADGLPVAGTTDLSAETFRLTFIGV